jgi:hypothetical protein
MSPAFELGPFLVPVALVAIGLVLLIFKGKK